MSSPLTQIAPKKPASTRGSRRVAIPTPSGGTLDELLATVLALKQAVESLQGSGDGFGRALTIADLGDTLVIPDDPRKPEPRDPLNPDDGFGILDDALKQFRHTIDVELAAVDTELTNAISQARQELENLETTVEGVSAVADGAAAAVLTETGVRADADLALGARIDTVTAELEDTAAAVLNESIARADADSALASQVSGVSAVAGRQRVYSQSSAPTGTVDNPLIVGDLWIDTSNGNLLKMWDGDSWETSDVVVNSAAASILTEATARATADTALTGLITTQTSRVDTHEAWMTDSNYTRADKFSALSGRITTAQAKADLASADVSTEIAARVQADNALAGRIDNVNVELDDVSASGMYRLLATGSGDGAAAEFAVQVRASAGHSYGSAGMRLQAVSNGNSRVVFEADKFAVDVGPSAASPFTISGNQVRWAGEIHGGSIIANTIHGNSVVANTMSGDRIIANSMHANRLVAGSITANEIAAGQISAVHVGTSLGTVVVAGGAYHNVSNFANFTLHSAAPVLFTANVTISNSGGIFGTNSFAGSPVPFIGTLNIFVDGVNHRSVRIAPTCTGHHAGFNYWGWDGTWTNQVVVNMGAGAHHVIAVCTNNAPAGFGSSNYNSDGLITAIVAYR